jgi:hypothetical protein
MKFMKKFAEFAPSGWHLVGMAKGKDLAAPAVGRAAHEKPFSALESGLDESGLDKFGLAETPLDQTLDDALANFRLSIHAWSEAAGNRQRPLLAASPQRRLGRLAVGWALGCVLAAGGVSSGVWEHHQHEARIAAARVAEYERQVAEQRAQRNREEEENLMAKVDSDVSQEVPTAMQPLAQLMIEDQTQNQTRNQTQDRTQ